MEINTIISKLVYCKRRQTVTLFQIWLHQEIWWINQVSSFCGMRIELSLWINAGYLNEWSLLILPRNNWISDNGSLFKCSQCRWITTDLIPEGDGSDTKLTFETPQHALLCLNWASFSLMLPILGWFWSSSGRLHNGIGAGNLDNYHFN